MIEEIKYNILDKTTSFVDGEENVQTIKMTVSEAFDMAMKLESFFDYDGDLDERDVKEMSFHLEFAFNTEKVRNKNIYQYMGAVYRRGLCYFDIAEPLKLSQQTINSIIYDFDYLPDEFQKIMAEVGIDYYIAQTLYQNIGKLNYKGLNTTITEKLEKCVEDPKRPHLGKLMEILNEIDINTEIYNEFKEDMQKAYNDNDRNMTKYFEIISKCILDTSEIYNAMQKAVEDASDVERNCIVETIKGAKSDNK